MIKPGDHFGYLTVLSTYGKKAFCRCECGTEKLVRKDTLRSGRTKSCGCQKLRPIPAGTRFGLLTVVSYEGNSNWLCKCDCGNEKIVPRPLLLKGHTTSCGCLPKGRKPAPILPGDRFGKLTVISVDSPNVLCHCDCGNDKVVNRTNLLRGDTRSCGCMALGLLPKPLVSGTRFGHLTVLTYDGYWVLCRCDCGKEKVIRRFHLESGSIKSCGCHGKGLNTAT